MADGSRPTSTASNPPRRAASSPVRTTRSRVSPQPSWPESVATRTTSERTAPSLAGSSIKNSSRSLMVIRAGVESWRPRGARAQSLLGESNRGPAASRNGRQPRDARSCTRCRNSLGRGKYTSSSRTDRDSTLAAKRSTSSLTQASTTDSAALAPAVTSTVSSAPNQARSISAGPSIRCAGTPASPASSARRWLFELFWLPSTNTWSAWPASSRTASWRFCVA